MIKKKIYTRECKRCGRRFKTKHRYAKVCTDCYVGISKRRCHLFDAEYK